MKRCRGRKFHGGFSLVGSLFNLCASKRNGQGDGFASECVGGAAVGRYPDPAAEFAPADAEALVKGDKLGGGFVGHCNVDGHGRFLCCVSLITYRKYAMHMQGFSAPIDEPTKQR